MTLLRALSLAALAAGAVSAQTPCGTWTVTPTPFDPSWWEAELADVSALGPDEAWAVGHYSTFSPTFDIETFTLAMRWDGTQWTVVPTPSPAPYPGGTKAYLDAVGMITPNDVWAAGDAVGDAGGLSVGSWVMVQHWDGSSWSIVPPPAPPGGVSINFSGTRVHDIAAIASDDVWFGGQWGEPNAVGSVTWRPLAMHWDGSGLTVYPTPVVYDGAYGFNLVKFSVLASNDIWAVCQKTVGDTRKNVILHWDGSSWSLAGAPDSLIPRELTEIVAIAPNDVWAFGHSKWPTVPYGLHWDGSSWTQTTNVPLGTAADTLGFGQIYAGDSSIELFNGTTFTTVETFPSISNVDLFEIEAFGSCAMWAVGREFTAGKAPFAARMDPNPGGAAWTNLGNGLAGTNGTPVHAATGTLVPGTPGQLELASALPSSVAVAVLGTFQLDAPVFGGTLIPQPLYLYLVGVDGTGSNVLPFTTPPNTPSGFSFFTQYWVLDPGAPQSWAASNGLRGTSP